MELALLIFNSIRTYDLAATNEKFMAILLAVLLYLVRKKFITNSKLYTVPFV